MTEILGEDVVTDIRRLLNDAAEAEGETYEFTTRAIARNINMAIKQVVARRPQSAYTGLNTFNTEIALAVPTGDDELADNATIAMDVHWQNAVTYYALHLCFLGSNRSTANFDFAAKALKLFEESI